MGQVHSIVLNLEVIDENSLEQGWEVIGAGGFGQVFKARHCQWGRDVAIKLLCYHDGLKSDEYLVREAELMLYAKSPFVMKALAIFKGLRPPSPCVHVGLVMEVMEKGSLFSLQNQLNHLLPWPLVFRLVHQVALGMKYLHSLTPALIHKDLKPENILLDIGLNVKITDFGLAKFIDSVTAIHVKGAITTGFTPPEAISPPPNYTAGCAYDVYSYAMLLCSILGFDVRQEERPSLQDVESMNTPGLEELFELMVRCWNQNPDRRPEFTECTDVTEGLYEKHKSGINVAVLQVEKELVFLKHVCELTLDPNTVHRELSLSDNNRKVTRVGEDQRFPRPEYPRHPDRFTEFGQVMCRESLTGRCYWEVEWSGKKVDIAVTYSGINRQGSATGMFGYNDKSWSLECDGVANRYSVCHNKKHTGLPVHPSSASGRVAVYVDYSAGTLSFFTVSADTLTHLHTFQSTFTEPLYAGFYVCSDSSVCFCQIEEVQ